VRLAARRSIAADWARGSSVSSVGSGVALSAFEAAAPHAFTMFMTFAAISKMAVGPVGRAVVPREYFASQYENAALQHGTWCRGSDFGVNKPARSRLGT